MQGPFCPLLCALAWALLLTSIAHAAPKSPAMSAPPGWTLTFDDEFNGKTLDLSKWTPTDWASDINGELEYYAPDDVWLQNGFLRLRTQKRAHGGRDYTSGEVRSVGKFSQQYGRFEFRARLPQTFGTWSAEYLIAENDHWPPEIDVEEFLGKEPHTLHMTLHWQNARGQHHSYHSQRDDESVDYTRWHVYAIEWEPAQVRWYIDGRLYATSDPSSQVPHVPMYVRINTALGGWASEPREGSVWPQFHDVDYVRVYRRTAFPPPVNAGPDQELTLGAGNSVSLAGLSCNPMGAHRATWSAVGGPSSVRFTRPHSLQTNAVFATPGTYRLRLTVDDGAASAYDDLTVYVDPAEAVSLLPAADAYTFVNSGLPAIHADGAGPELLVGTRPSVGGSRDTLRSYLRFDISQAPKVRHAVLRLYGGQTYVGTTFALDCAISPVAAPMWDEKATEWPALPTVGLMPMQLSVPAAVHHSTERWYAVDITQYVQAQQAAGQTAIGFALAPADAATQLTAAFRSREDTAHAPHLVLTP